MALNTTMATDADFYEEMDTENWPAKNLESVRVRSPRPAFTQARRLGYPSKRPTTPGPHDYRVEDVVNACEQVGAVIGRAPARGDFCSEYKYPDVTEEGAVPDGREKFPQSRRAVFGKASRLDRATDIELAKSCPMHGALGESPGFRYDPDYSCAGGRRRPRSAPSWRFPVSNEERAQPLKKTTVGKDCPFLSSEAALGRQCNSKRTTKPASSFSRASRFPSPTHGPGGELTAECKEVPQFGQGSKDGTGRHQRPTSASFGRATRDGCARTRICQTAQDRPPSAGKPMRMPHYPLPTRQEVARYGSGQI